MADTPTILAELERLIDAAEQQIVLQMYLFAADGQLELLLPRPGSPPHAETVAGWLIEKKRRKPEVSMVVILDTNTPADPGRTRARALPVRAELERSGITVLHANLFYNRFDASRRLLSPRRNFHLRFRDCPPAHWVERQNRWQVAHNLEDHRKNLVIDGGRAGLVMSHNLIDLAGDWYENAFLLKGAIARELWSTATTALEKALELPHAATPDQAARADELARRPPVALEVAPNDGMHDAESRLLEAEAIRTELRAVFERAGAGDRVYVASAYFSDVGLLDALAGAARRGASVKILIDSIAGLPLPGPLSFLLRNLVNHKVTRPARRLCERLPGFELRVHDSSAGRLMHLKSCALIGENSVLIGGQANFTRNSFSGAWLETDVVTRAPAALLAFQNHFETLWRLPEARPLGRPSLWQRSLDLLRSAGLWAFARFGLEP